MQTQENKFYVRSENGVVTSVLNSHIQQPVIEYKGGGIKWYEDKVRTAKEEKC